LAVPQFSPTVVDAFFFAAALLSDQPGLAESLQRAA
jgi:hypothetical protein